MALKLAQKTRDQGHQVSIVSNGPKKSHFKKNGMTVFLIPGQATLTTYLIHFYSILFFLYQIKPDIIHVQGLTLQIYVCLINRFFQLPLAAYLNESIDVCPSFYQPLLIASLKKAEKVFVSCQYLKNQYSGKGLGLKQIAVSRIGLEPKYLKMPTPNISRQGPLLYFGDANKERGFDFFFRLAQNLPNLKFQVLIRRADKNCAQELKAIKKLNNVSLYFYPYSQPLEKFILKSSLVLLPYRWMGLRPPFSLIEAMALGKCVLTSTLPANSEVIENNKNGLILNFHQSNKTAAKIKQLLKDKAKQLSLGEQARSTIKKIYSPQEYQKIFVSYDELLKDELLKQKLLRLCQKIYPLAIKKDAIDWGQEGILAFAQKNRLAHFLYQENKAPFFLYQEYKDYQKRLKNSLKKIKQVLKKRKFMIIKTFSSYPHLTSDIDVLVKDSQGLSFPILIDQKNLLYIHMEKEMAWRGALAVSDKFIWQNTTKANFNKSSFLTANAKLDCLIRIGHAPFESAHFKLGELLYLYRQLKRVNWQDLKNEARSMGWPKTFKQMEKILNDLHWTLFQKPHPKIKTPPSSSWQKISFPFNLPLWVLIGLVREKRAWIKVWGGRYIIKERLASWCKRKIF